MDRDKVIKGLKHCINHDGPACISCPYDRQDCVNDLCADALALLKEQDERIKLLEHQLETITKWRANSGAFD